MEEKQITLQIDRHYITVPEGLDYPGSRTENRYEIYLPFAILI